MFLLNSQAMSSPDKGAKEFSNLLKEGIQLFGEIKKINSSERFIAFFTSFCSIIISYLVVVFIAYIIVKDNAPTSTGILFILATIFLLLFVVIFSYKIYHFDQEFDVPFKDAKEYFRKLDNKLSIIEKSLKLSSVDAYNHLANSIDHKSYEEWIRNFAIEKRRTIDPLKLIAKVAGQSNDAVFKCVIAYKGFFIDSDVEEMIEYFASFQKATSENKITRIFTSEGVKNQTSKGFYSLEHIDEAYFTSASITDSNIKENLIQGYNQHRIIILKYLLINQVCGVKTYFQVYQKNTNFPEQNFITKADYVIALNHLDDASNTCDVVYFAYPEEPTTKVNQSVATSDNYFIHMLEIDFERRIASDTSSDKTNIIELKDEKSFYKILDLLRLFKVDNNKKYETEIINPTIQELIKSINENKYLESYGLDKREIEKRLKVYGSYFKKKK